MVHFRQVARTWLVWCALLLMAALTVLAALWMNRAYQDSWVLDGIWIPLLLFWAGFVVFAYHLPDLRQVTILAAIATFLIYAVPALKYAYPYTSSIDVAAHTSTVRFLSETGYVDPSSAYRDTPGFHVVVAALSQLSGIRSEFWSKLMPPLLGSLVPLALYALSKRASLPDSLARIVIILSGLSLPLLYALNGTTFTVPLMVVLLVWALLREMDEMDARARIAYTVLLLLLLITITLWHPGTSLVLMLVLVAAGAVLALGSKGTLFLKETSGLLSLGILSAVISISYWMYEAGFVWRQFIKNIGLALQPEATPELVPNRFFELAIQDRLLILSFAHARDALFLALAVLGVALLLKYGGSERFSRLLRTYGLVCLFFLGTVFLVFVIGFGAQGYQRFLRQSVAVTSLIAGYGLWKGLQSLRRLLPWPSEKLMAGASLLVILTISSIQLYPYQPAVPVPEAAAPGSNDAPVLWLHQVNTLYQYQMLRFALDELPQDEQLVADYIGYWQSRLFFSIDVISRLRRTVNQEKEPSYLLLHWPGKAGAYAEQAEFRSMEAIEAWRNRPGMSTVYENGGSFILYYPQNAQEPFALER